MTKISDILEQGIDIIAREVTHLSDMDTELDFKQQQKLCDYLKTLVSIERDQRLSKEKDETDLKKMTPEELDAAIKEELEKLDVR